MQTAVSFPDWLKRRRRSLDLTREALAQRAYCSASAVRRMEAGDLRPSRELARLLAAALEVPPAVQDGFVQFARGLIASPPAMEATDAALPPTPPADIPGNLPTPLTSLVGRKQEIAVICNLLRKPGVRLLTISGPPGTGKTRLSLAAAAQLGGQTPFPQGAYFAPLALVNDVSMVAPTIAATLGLSEAHHAGKPVLQVIQEHLRLQRLLLVLDNFEQVISAAPIITELLTTVPGLKVLVTSREVLHVYGEHEFPLLPLPLPDVNHFPTETAVSYLARFSAIRLFQDRARAVKPDFSLTPDNVADVARICAWLDGLPLAIEMAAAQMKWLPPDKALFQLQRRLTALTGGPRDLTPRQQSLLGAFSWSYDLLTNRQQRLFAVLGIFVGGCNEAAIRTIAAEVGANEGDLLDPHSIAANLQMLVEKSLLTYQPLPAGDGRYVMLESLREFALMQLEAQNLSLQAGQAHAYYYARLAETAVNSILAGGEQAAWLNCLEQDQYNIRAALDWATETSQRAPFALALVESMYHFWFIRGHLAEGRGWLEKALALDSEPSILRAQVFNRVGQIARVQGDLLAALDYNQKALALQQAAADKNGMCRSLESLAILAGTQGNYGSACSLLEQTLHLRREIGDNRFLASTLNNLAIVYRRLGDLPAAEPLYQECADLCRAASDLRSLSHALHGLGEVLVEKGDPAAGLPFFRESLALRYQLDNRPEIVNSLGALAMVLKALHNGVGAARLLAASFRLREELGIQLSPTYLAEAEESVAQVRQITGEAVFVQAWAEGQDLSLHEAVHWALSFF